MRKLYGIIVVLIANLFTGCGKNQTAEIGTQEPEIVLEFDNVDFSHLFTRDSEKEFVSELYFYNVDCSSMFNKR